MESEDFNWALGPIIVPGGPSILIVGPDNVGKTTLAGHMSEIMGIPIWKCPSEKEIFRESRFSGGKSLIFDFQLTNFLQQTGYRIISDRAYICEEVYSKVFGRETDGYLLSEIDLRHFKMGTKVVYAYSSVLPAAEDDLVPKEMYAKVKEAYDDFFDRSCFANTVIRYDTASMIATFQAGGDSSRETALDILRELGEIL